MRRALDVFIPYLYPHGYALLRARTPQRHTRAQWETRRYESGVEWEKPSRPESRGLWKGYCLGVIR